MEIFSMVLSLLSGVAMFLFGMSLMGDGLKMVAGNKLEAFLYKMTNTPLKGVLLGTGVTCVIQSSSATTVMVVGFVNSGMMKLRQAIGIIMGANIGTSITGWILCLSYLDGSSGIAQILSSATLTAVVSIVGIIMKMVSKHTTYKNIGNIMLGFAILMFGMQTMSGAVEPLRENPFFIRMITMFTNPIAGILAGILFTAVIQSASAAVGILQALCMTGTMTFASIFPITLGIGVGAACPVLMSAIGANKNGKRTAIVYLLNDLFGMIVWGILFYAANAVVHFGFMDLVMTPVSTAFVNSVYRAATVLVLFWFIPKIESLVKRLIKDSPEELEDEKDFDLLEERLLTSPHLAIAQCQRAIIGMAKKVRKNVGRALDLINDYSQEGFNKIQQKEELIDKYEGRLGEYLMKLTKREMHTSQTRQVSIFLHSIADFERIGDYASYIAYEMQEINERGILFSEEAKGEMAVVIAAVREAVRQTVDAFKDNDWEKASKVAPLAARISILCNEMKLNHVARLQRGECSLEQGTSFNDILESFDHIASHCTSAVTAMIKSGDDSDIHIHSQTIYDFSGEDYRRLLKEYEDKYEIGITEETKQHTEASAG